MAGPGEGFAFLADRDGMESRLDGIGLSDAGFVSRCPRVFELEERRRRAGGQQLGSLEAKKPRSKQARPTGLGQGPGQGVGAIQDGAQRRIARKRSFCGET